MMSEQNEGSGGNEREREGREGQEALRFKWFGWTESGSKQYRKSHRIRERRGEEKV